MVMEVVHEDMGDGNMQCTNHPYKNSPRWDLRFCLQEKLGKLVSSSFPVAVFPSSSSSSSSPSFRSDFGGSNTTSSGGAATVGTPFRSATLLLRLSTLRVEAMTIKEKKREDFVVVGENGSPDQAAFDRKVSRSRSVGCGSRSFSGDFFERISTGFGDCTLRRVESQREGKPRLHSVHRNGGNSGNNGQDCIKETEDNNVNGKSISSVRHVSHGRSRSWGWALASPMRAFSKPSSGKRDATSNKNVTPNLAAIPSLLAVSG
ncbi:UNVERIFIED_CONTAM: hypothetical protein Sradi_1677300 [Sesamum radiatum]|uniref:Uncharacterized protein n=1 Tax=Sesamum radiatum TaxID=300843 RepID=A0AAW2UBU3_SESRA